MKFMAETTMSEARSWTRRISVGSVGAGAAVVASGAAAPTRPLSASSFMTGSTGSSGAANARPAVAERATANARARAQRPGERAVIGIGAQDRRGRPGTSTSETWRFRAHFRRPSPAALSFGGTTSDGETMFQAVLLEKDEAGFRAGVRTVANASLPEGDAYVSI